MQKSHTHVRITRLRSANTLRELAAIPVGSARRHEPVGHLQQDQLHRVVESSAHLPQMLPRHRPTGANSTHAEKVT